MKAVAMRKGLIGLGSSLVVLFAAMPGIAAADTYPYFKAYGADVSAGGWFKDSSGSCAANYQAGTSGNPLTGGIATYAKTAGSGTGTQPRGGASSQYGVFADGTISSANGAGGAPNSGFYSNSAAAGSQPVAQLTFANVINGGSSVWGGSFDGGSPQADQCIPDYYGSINPSDTQAMPNGDKCSGTLDGVSSGIYKVDPTANGCASNTYTINGGTIGEGNNITLLVNGNAFINNNIPYTTSYVASTTPKFSLIVRGNIYVAPGIIQMDGWYIAQPKASGSTPTSDDGIIWTCHDGTDAGTSVDYTFELGCTNKLVVNGALTAKWINFGRIGGDVLTQASNSEDASADKATNAAEVINYNPAMVANGGFFSKTSNSVKIDSLVSLPPIF